MEIHQHAERSRVWRRRLTKIAQSTNSYGMVLLLIILDYTSMSVLYSSAWGRLCIVIFLSTTLIVTAHAAHLRRIWHILGIGYLILSMLVTLCAALLPGSFDVGKQIVMIGGILLFITPFVILRQINTHQMVTRETLLGAICVYLLLGLSWTFIFVIIGFLSPTPFFTSGETVGINQYLFFSYTTLTTVGYGNLVPANDTGQTFAVLEALCGQMYLVVVVARLVALWGLVRFSHPDHQSMASSHEEAVKQVNELPDDHLDAPHRDYSI